jgi:hypothetical protein
VGVGVGANIGVPEGAGALVGADGVTGGGAAAGAPEAAADADGGGADTGGGRTGLALRPAFKPRAKSAPVAAGGGLAAVAAGGANAGELPTPGPVTGGISPMPKLDGDGSDGDDRPPGELNCTPPPAPVDGVPMDVGRAGGIPVGS